MPRTVFAVLSFEGPDAYSRVGGLATRVSGLATELARLGHETHLFFIGDPHLQGHEVLEGGLLHLRRWCQWISRNHPGGAYDGEEGKLWDWSRSIPQHFLQTFIPERLNGDTQVIVLAEEWQTTESVIAIHSGLRELGAADRVMLVWNANNTYGFDRIRWAALQEAATITTVSRYMKFLMQAAGISARAVPNGIDESWLQPLEDALVTPLVAAVRGRTTVTKVARWDAEKRWDYAVDSVALMKEMGLSPVFLARGGSPERGAQVVRRMEQKGLTVSKVRWDSGDAVSLSHAIMPRLSADVVLLESLLQEEQLKLLYTVSDAVLANSVVEPFGLVGLETMAAGGIAAVGATGEDYVTNGYDAISLQTDDVREFVRYVARLKNYKGAQQAMRAEARKSAARYTWRAVIERALLPFVREIGFEVGDAGDDGAASDSSPAPQGVASGRTNGVRLDPS